MIMQVSLEAITRNCLNGLKYWPVNQGLRSAQRVESWKGIRQCPERKFKVDVPCMYDTCRDILIAPESGLCEDMSYVQGLFFFLSKPKTPPT
jgi:hypothetical protein